MTPVINIYYIKINNISNNGSFSVGETFHHGHAVNSKSTGMNASYGDESPPIAQMRNVYVDPDMVDQGSYNEPQKEVGAGEKSKTPPEN